MNYLEVAKRVTEQRNKEKPHTLDEVLATRQAITRLQLGKTDAVRFYSETCRGEFLAVKDKSTLSKLEGVMSIDTPTFTLAELTELIGRDKEVCAKVYMVKQAFAGSRVVPDAHKAFDSGGDGRFRQHAAPRLGRGERTQRGQLAFNVK